MESLISYLPKVYDKALEFDISIHDAQFNHEGRYFLKLSIQSLHTNDYSSIQVRKPKTNVFTNDYEVETDVVRQPESQVLARFHDNKFTFRLPTGFCKNDKNHDVYLLVEAFSLPDNGEMGKKVGEGKFAIYPRPNAPKIRAYVERGEDFYNYTDIISLLRTLSTDSVQMHCGRVRANYALREMVPVKPRSPILTPPPKRKVVHRPTPRPKRLEPPPPPSPTSSWGHDKLSLQLPESPELPPLSTNRQLTERPLGEKDNSTFIIGNAYRHVASKGKEQIDMILHGATSLPMTQEEKVPKAFVVSNVRAPHEKDQGNGAVTHTSLRPTTAPAWEEMVHCETTEETAKDENLMLSVADGPSKQELVDYIIPLHYLKPFHQYHLELVKQQKGVPNGVRVFATITRKLPQLPKDPACPNYLGLEVLLQSVQKPLQTSPGPLIAVARIVPDFYNYKSDYLVSHPRTAGVTMTSVTFPSPHPSAFIVPPRTKHGYPQISLPGRPDVQPKWNHPYLFCDERDKATIFTPSAALVIEYYVATTAMSDQFWRVKSPMGFSALQMDQDMYKELIKDNAKKGLRVEGLPIQGSDVVTVEGKQPTVGMILRLITTNEPDSMVQVSNMEDLPVLDLYPEPSLGYYRTGDGGKTPEVLTVTFADEKSLDTTAEEVPDTPPPDKPAYFVQKKKKRPLSPIKDGEMPSYEAVESVLPEYQYIFVDPDKGGPPHGTRHPPPPIATQYPGVPSTSRAPDDLDKTSMSVLDHQMKELENYRAAVHKMGQDILALRQQVRDLEANNSQLRRDLANYNDASKLMIDSSELDNLTKPEVMSRYAALKQTLTRSSGDISAYKDKVQKLQNELIKKNDQEKKFLQIQQSYKHQSELVVSLQAKIKKMRQLEEACKKQERVIERMEKVLEKQHKERGKRGTDKAAEDANAALLEENKRLRQQTEDLRDQLRLTGRNAGNDTDKLELYQSLEKAEARIQALEKQLDDNSRSWGRERADMNIRLNEAEHGFGRSGGMVLHDYPLYASSKSRNDLLYVASRERIFINEVEPILVPNQYTAVSDMDIDTNARRITEFCSLTEYGTPMFTPGDGNCLFNAVSLCLNGNISLSSELRLRTCIEMATNSARYLNDPLFQTLGLGVPDYEGYAKAVIDCAVKGRHSSIYTMWALAEVLNTPIHSIYPSINGSQDNYHQKLTCVLPLSKPSSNTPIHILWCGGLLTSRISWSPDHFVPLLSYQPLLEVWPFLPEEENCSTPRKRDNPFQVHSSYDDEILISPPKPSDMPITESLSCTDVPQTNATFVISSDRSCADTIPYVSTFDDATIPYDIDSPTSRNSKGQPTKFSPVNSEGQHNSCSPIFEQIPHGGLNAKDIMALVTSKEKRVYNTVPSGRKENVYFVVDNQKNKKNGHDQRRRVFFDDCGVWNTSRRTTIRDHIATEGMKSVTLRNGVYCTEKTVKGTKQWVPLSPQPERKDVVQIHRYYTSLRADENFKRIVIWVTSTSRPELDNVAIYQYQGKFPEGGCEQPHGNAKENGRPYKRTDPKQLEKVRDEPDEKKPKKIYREMVLNDSINAPRDIKLIRNARYTQRVKDHGKVTGNAADEILSLISSIDQHPYVQKIEHTKNNVPAIILYDDDQLEDFRFFVRSRTEYRVGIDRTFNLGPYFVTCVVYKNIRVVRNDTSGHPIFLGPVLLHKEATFETYHYFFSHLKAKLSIDLNRIDLAIPGFFEFGSDDEKALVKALDSCFPNAQRALCTKHLKDNVTCYLRDKAGVTREDRRVISNLIFGQRGLVNAEDSFEFQQRSTRIIRASTQFPRFLQYFERNLQNRIRDYVNAPRRNSDLDSSLWTNNNAESMNHVLKVAANWQPKSITDLVELLYNEVKLQLTDLRRSLHGDGNYRLAVQFQRYALKKSVIMTMPRDRRLQLFRNFLRDTKKTSRPSHIVSKNGKLAVANKLNKVARKPGQRQRLKSHRTRDRNL